MTPSLVTLPDHELAIHSAWGDARAGDVIRQFFEAEIDNEQTRRAYKAAAIDFFRFVTPGLTGGLLSLNPLHVSGWLAAMRGKGLAVPTIKQRLAGLRMLFDALAREQVIRFNPASVVKGPKHSVTRGKTPVIDAADVQQLLASIDTATMIGLRDRALIATMAYSFARISAVTMLKVGDVFHQKQRLWLRLTEKGGKIKDVPCHHLLQEYLSDWLEGAKLSEHADTPLFRTFAWAPPNGADGEEEASGERVPCQRILTARPMTQPMAWEMIQRRAQRAGIATRVCNHSFRAAGITAYLENGGTIERAAHIAGHASTRTTQLYDRRPDDVTLDEIERIRFA